MLTDDHHSLKCVLQTTLCTQSHAVRIDLTMIDQDPEVLRKQIAALEEEHRALDRHIGELAHDTTADQVELRRMKKRKLAIKDAVERLRSQLIPDLNA
jgi:hypothetical protein